jgi:hypothetical protein
MGRIVRRVPLDFSWPLSEVWSGFLSPDRFSETPCEACDGKGYSPEAQHFHNLWYGYEPFDPASTGCVALTPDTPAVRRFAERNVASAPDFYGTGEGAIVREAQRLVGLWNGQWCHHLTQADVDALVDGNRLWDFTRSFSREDGWQEINPVPRPTAAEVNEWSLAGFGHDSINAMIVIRARCERDGVSETCPSCDGHGSHEAYAGQRAEAEAWEPTEPPAGDGWQLWETVSEGSPISPVFASAGDLAAWMSNPERGKDWVPPAVAAKFVAEGWAPSLIGSPETGIVSGVEVIGSQD